MAANMFVCFFHGGFCQAVGQRLCQEVLVVISVVGEPFKSAIHRGHKKPDFVCDRRDEVCQGEVGWLLLTEKRQAHRGRSLRCAVGLEHDVVILRMAGTEHEAEMTLKVLAVDT